MRISDWSSDVCSSDLALLGQAGLPTGTEEERGWDHGVFIPMTVALPQADIPLVQLSLRHDLDPEAHIAAGRRSAERRVGKECGSTCRSRWSPYHYKTNCTETQDHHNVQNQKNN